MNTSWIICPLFENGTKVFQHPGCPNGAIEGDASCLRGSRRPKNKNCSDYHTGYESKEDAEIAVYRNRLTKIISEEERRLNFG